MLLHLPLDIIFNGKFASGGLVPFYSFIVRARAGFRAARFTDRPPRPATDEGFWTVFFKGARLASDSAENAGGRLPTPRETPPVRS
jgi:hypothetical protein